MKLLKQLSLKEWLSTLIIASAAFLLLGTITALWNNSFFIRMKNGLLQSAVIAPNSKNAAEAIIKVLSHSFKLICFKNFISNPLGNYIL